MTVNDPRRQSRFSKILAGIALPAGIAFTLLASLIVWRLLVLGSASAAEDRADHILVTSAKLASDLTHVQSQERGFLLTRSPSAFGNDVSPTAIVDDLANLDGILDDPQQRKQLQPIAKQYEQWTNQAVVLIRRQAQAKTPIVYTAAELQIEPTHRLNRAMQVFLAEQQDYRERKSMEVDAQVRVVVFCAIAGSLLVGALLLLSGWRLLVLDMERRRRESELEEENRRMSEAARIKSEFVAHMSHEFRSPLTAILGLGELLYDGKAGPLSPVQREHVDDILTSGHHLLGLINQVLDVAKLEAGKIAFSFSDCRPCAVAEETLTTLRPLAHEKRIALRTDCTRAPLSVVADSGRFKQILYNYLSNALHYTPPGGIVTLRIFRVSGERYRVEVRDTGPGIAPEDVAKLFKDFSQLGTRTGQSSDGTGLGLALTKRIVEAQGGIVGVDSTLGQGCIFYAELPCDPRGAGAAA
jgi:signal transduction histidine kinase